MAGHELVRPLIAQRRTYAVVAVLLAVAVLCWGLLVTQFGDDGMTMAPPSLTGGLSALPFMVMWVIMMIAMMFPGAIPMVLAFHKVQASRQRAGGVVAITGIFLSGYMLVWTTVGIVAYLAAGVAVAAGETLRLSVYGSARAGGLCFVLAGLYQLTPLKRVCLAKCRTPVAFIMTSWRGGRYGALVMGTLHGGYCLGCCWLLFVILFPLGIMSLLGMAAVTLLILSEKLLPWGERFGRAAAIVLVLYGGTVIAISGPLPSIMNGPSTMPSMPMR